MSEEQRISLSILDRLEVGSPCTASWSEMKGDSRTRRCEQCRLDVHNISDFRSEEAEAFLRTVEERLSRERVCIRFYSRRDGTVLTQDCPRGLAAIRSAARAVVRRVALAGALLLGGGIYMGMRGERAVQAIESMSPFREIRGLLGSERCVAGRASFRPPAPAGDSTGSKGVAMGDDGEAGE